MTTIYTDISAALDGHLDTLATAESYTVIWQNRDTKRPNEVHLRQSLIPVETMQSDMGANGQDYTQVIYQVDVVVPANKGKLDMMAAADKVADHFARGTNLTYNTVTLRVTTVQRDPVVFDVDYVFMPVTITAETYTNPR